MTESIAPPDTSAFGEVFTMKIYIDIFISGKTCLTYRFCSGKFPEKSEATIGKILCLCFKITLVFHRCGFSRKNIRH
jgi:hypothetical protein